MELSETKIKEYTKRLILSRMRLLCNNSFYGLLLMNVKFSLDTECETAMTDGKRIIFGPEFLDSISDTELDFVLMHELLHIVLQHVFRQDEKDNFDFNIACDIVVNSIILDSNDGKLSSITLSKYGESMHLTPYGKEGSMFTAEEVYAMIEKRRKKNKDSSGNIIDSHDLWGTIENNETLKDEWKKRFADVCESINGNPSNATGKLPKFAERMLKEMKKAQTDWRTLLCDFVEEEIVDYSFMPPDRRFCDSPFFLPDYNEKDECVKKILFMIDTSGSITDNMMTQAFSEVRGALEQYNNRLEGWLGFFDTMVSEPKAFEGIDELSTIKPIGGGGTSFDVIFEYVFNNMSDDLPVSIIILTDGYAEFPKESVANGIPVLWLINNDEVTSPWGKVARIIIDE